ncbi:MAG: hypothetical protein ACRD94_02400 [Nitrosopumilaceae archaeon]
MPSVEITKTIVMIILCVGFISYFSIIGAALNGCNQTDLSKPKITWNPICELQNQITSLNDMASIEKSLLGSDNVLQQQFHIIQVLLISYLFLVKLVTAKHMKLNS